jgi:hypothetical protein
MIEKYFIILWLTWHLYNYGPPPILFNIFLRIYYNYDKFFLFVNKVLHGDYWYEDEDDEIDNKEINNEDIIIKEPPKYEDKYLKDIRLLNKEWIFTEEENNELMILNYKFFNDYKESILNKIEEINKEIINLEKEKEDSDSFSYIESDEMMSENSSNDINEDTSKKIQELQEEYNKLKLQIENEEGIEEIKKICEEKGKQNIINKRLDKLDNCYIIEKTPIGNVLMIYDKTKETFKYYSDCNIPYRYLEVVGRKYVKLFNCRPIFIDMEEELRLFEEKWEKEQEIKKIKEEEEKKQSENKQLNNETNKKKNVFAKFKSYNKDAGGKISMAPPPKNSIPNKNVTENKEDEKILLKERANRYTYEGKFANFNFLKKIDRKVFNKKLGLSFADFKKLQK